MKRIIAGVAIAILLITIGIIWMDEKPSNSRSSADYSLTMKKWNWVSTEYGDGKVITPLKPDRFSITFVGDGTFSASTDCNGIAGSYVAKGKYLSFTNMVSTLMACGPSQEREFTDMLTQTQSYSFTSKGQLVLNLKVNKGSFNFQ